MIKSVSVQNFKSLSTVSIELGKFTCLVGINGAGKSTILQAIDFLPQLMNGKIGEWLERRDWLVINLLGQRHKVNILISVAGLTSSGEEIGWAGRFNSRDMRCTAETLLVGDKTLLSVKLGKYSIGDEKASDINFKYQGSILSQLLESDLPEEVMEFKKEIASIRSLELLSPHLLRLRARKSETDIGAGGEKLSAYLDTLKGEQRTNLIAQLKLFYPRIVDFKVSNLRSGWKKLIVIEEYNGQRLETEARHINDGLLRIMAILAQTGTEHSLLLLDEIENGINPEIIEKLVDALVNAPRQILVTTHSPMILNYLEDDVARKSVQFVYKNEQGATLVRPFFSIPHISKKLDFMGAGEAFIDTDLNELTKECLTLDDAEQVAIGDKDAP